MSNSRYKIVFYALSLVTAFILFPASSYAADKSNKAGDVSRGSREWANNCNRCHNLRDPKEFRDDMWEPIVMHMRVTAGLTGQQARDILAFLQASNFTPVTTGTSRGATLGLTGEQIFKQTCIACHGADGKGAIPGIPDLKERLNSKSEGVLLGHIENGFQSPGSPMAMPPKGGNPNLTSGDLRNVLEYIEEEFK